MIHVLFAVEVEARIVRELSPADRLPDRGAIYEDGFGTHVDLREDRG